MIDFVTAFKSLIKLGIIHIDNNIFKLHYKFTCILLILFSILLTSKQFFGEPIECDVQHQSKALINTYCWIYGTFTVRLYFKEKVLPGVGAFSKPEQPYITAEAGKSPEILSQKYYQWVCLIFCFQALLFYIPRYVWKIWEGGRLRLLVNDLGSPILIASDDCKKQLLNYLLKEKYGHDTYALRFASCEVLNCLNVIGQILALDFFLMGNFLNYGSAVAFNKLNTMSEVFPRMTKCTYFDYGPSGTTQVHDALCILPLNILNEKLFLFMWIWFFVLAALSLYQVAYRCCVLFSSSFREKILRSKCKGLSEIVTHAIAKHFSFGDMFFLELLSRNLNPVIFKQLLLDLFAAISLNETVIKLEKTMVV